VTTHGAKDSAQDREELAGELLDMVERCGMDRVSYAQEMQILARAHAAARDAGLGRAPEPWIVATPPPQTPALACLLAVGGRVVVDPDRCLSHGRGVEAAARRADTRERGLPTQRDRVLLGLLDAGRVTMHDLTERLTRMGIPIGYTSLCSRTTQMQRDGLVSKHRNGRTVGLALTRRGLREAHEARRRVGGTQGIDGAGAAPSDDAQEGAA
jgi:hypothetical protein